MLQKYISACLVKFCQTIQSCILPPSYLVNRFSILCTFLLLCFYFGFSFLQFFLIYNLNLKWYKSLKAYHKITRSQLKLHWQALPRDMNNSPKGTLSTCPSHTQEKRKSYSRHNQCKMNSSFLGALQIPECIHNMIDTQL